MRSPWALALLALVACTSASAPSEPLSGKTTAAAAPSASAAPAAPASSAPDKPDAGTADATPEVADAAVDAPVETADAAAAAPPPFAKDNKILPPLESQELTERAKALFDAIVNDDPPRGESFWFPKEPFIPLKDVKGPDKYWDNLHKTYERDIHALHKKRKSWEGATFVSFKVGSTPKWVPPGDEANKIGYYRSFRGKLEYSVEGKTASFEVHTIISWQGRWYITHLSKFKKK